MEFKVQRLGLALDLPIVKLMLRDTSMYLPALT